MQNEQSIPTSGMVASATMEGHGLSQLQTEDKDGCAGG
jgi:hypothetical protein